MKKKWEMEERGEEREKESGRDVQEGSIAPHLHSAASPWNVVLDTPPFLKLVGTPRK